MNIMTAPIILGRSLALRYCALLFGGLLLISSAFAQQPTRLGDLDADSQPTVLDLVRLINPCMA